MFWKDRRQLSFNPRLRSKISLKISKLNPFMGWFLSDLCLPWWSPWIIKWSPDVFFTWKCYEGLFFLFRKKELAIICARRFFQPISKYDLGPFILAARGHFIRETEWMLGWSKTDRKVAPSEKDLHCVPLSTVFFQERATRSKIIRFSKNVHWLITYILLL